MKNLLVLFLLSLSLCLGGCAHVSKHKEYDSTGQLVSETYIKTPKSAVSSGEFSSRRDYNEDGTLKNIDTSLSSGHAQKFDQALRNLSKSANFLAGFLVVAGIASIILRTWFPVIPMQASIILLAAGVVIWALPVLYDRYLLYIIIGLVIVGGLYLYGVFDNWKLLSTESPKKKKQPIVVEE